MKKFLLILPCVIILCSCDFESNKTKCGRIISVVGMTVCDDYANNELSYYYKGWKSKQDCFNDVKADFMEVCEEQIKSGGAPSVIRNLEMFTKIKTSTK